LFIAVQSSAMSLIYFLSEQIYLFDLFRALSSVQAVTLCLMVAYICDVAVLMRQSLLVSVYQQWLMTAVILMCSAHSGLIACILICL